MPLPYRLIHDPGHGWLEVTEKELLALGIAHSISRFSFTTGPRPGGVSALVYLEEDCDFAKFAVAKGWTKQLEPGQNWRNVYQEETFIRKLPAYQVPDPQRDDNMRRVTPDELREKGMMADPAGDFEPLDAEQREALRQDLEDEARTAQAADAFNLSPLDTRGEGWTL